MISKNQIKYIRSLALKKNREKSGCFVGEGPKVVADLMARQSPEMLVATNEWYASTNVCPRKQDLVVSAEELGKVSFLQHPQDVLGIFMIPLCDVSSDVCANELCLALDKVQDPGNLGTIIRIADWFGITTIFCSPDTADAFNPKVVQATMGSIARVRVVYTDLCALLDGLPEGTPVYATSLDGDNIYTQELSSTGVIIMGNEGNGVSPQVMSRVNRTLFIPCYRESSEIDSLNVAVATAVACAEFKRRNCWK